MPRGWAMPPGVPPLRLHRQLHHRSVESSEKTTTRCHVSLHVAWPACRFGDAFRPGNENDAVSPELPVRWRWLALNLLMAAFYLALAGSSISAFHLAPAVWPPTAVGVLAAMFWGASALPGIGLGALLANLLMLHWPPALAAWGALGSCVAPLLAIRGMGSARATRPELWEQPLTVSTFLFWMGPAQAAVSALFGSVGLLAAGMIAPSQFWSVLVDSAI